MALILEDSTTLDSTVDTTVDDLIESINDNLVSVLTERIARVHAIHIRRPWHWMPDGTHYGQKVFPDRCKHCKADWPCETIAAITD